MTPAVMAQRRRLEISSIGRAILHDENQIGRMLRRCLVLLPALFTSALFAAWPPAQPSQLVLTVRENGGVARTGEVVRSGVPIPRSLNVTGTAGLAVVDGSGGLVPAQFRILARWNAGLASATAPIQWLLVIFPATVPANGTATYRLVFDGSAGANPAPATALTIQQVGNTITVNTGAARFVIGGNAGALFDEVRLADNTRVVSTSAMTARVNGADYTHPTTRGVEIEHSGPLSAAVIVDGAYNMPLMGVGPAGGGGLGTKRRYLFSAGSPVAIVRQSAAFEGDLCNTSNQGAIACNGAPNAIRVQQLRDALTLDLAYPVSATASGAFNATTSGAIASTQTAAVRQLLRTARTNPQAFTVDLPGVATVNGVQADGGMLAVSSGIGAVAIAIDKMHRYEPQALRVLNDGRLAIDLVDTAATGGSAWLGARQGLFATLAVGALPAGPSRATLDRQVWAPLNRPLHAWPSAQWIGASDAVDEFPVGALPDDFSGYDAKAVNVHDNTLAQVDARGLNGLMTFGVYPRNWGNPILTDEIECDDVTPGEEWDVPYWCATWTDYHNTVMSIPVFAFRNGQTSWLDDLATPGALRSLHTQVFNCGPGDNFFYCGQAPAGYGGYRADFNSSHAYLDNLMTYYWLTGDSTVVDMLQRGATSMRNYFCPSRPGSACAATVAPNDDFANVNGRVFTQWHWIFRFVGLASDDASFLDDYRNNIGREYTHNWAQLQQGGVTYGFLIDGTLQTTITGPGTYSTDQLWMASMYDMNLLYRLQRDTNDSAIGSPAVVPSQIIAAWARTLRTFGASVGTGGNGTPGGNWPNALNFTFTGARIGGTLTNVTANEGGGDPFLYETGKAALTAVMTRAADFTGEPALNAMSLALANFAWDAAEADPTPLGKQQGEFFTRLPSSIARLALGNGPPFAPANLVATASGASSIGVTWDAVAGATSYQLDRRSAGGGFTQIATPGTNSFNDGVSANTAHLYRVRAVNGNGASDNSNVDLATTVLFTNDPLVAGTTVVQNAHVTQLRTAVNAVRSLAALAPFPFPTDTVVRAAHVVDLRSALDAARSALALPAMTYTNPVTAGAIVRATHVTEVRAGVR
jgi:hypothetical protein